MNNKTKTSATLTLFAVALAVVVIVLGAYTRLTDAGLGCPDWPGCYNHLLAPHNAQEVTQAAQQFPASPVYIIKAWTEMIHRYVAGGLGLFVFALGILAIRKRKVVGQPVAVPIVLMGLVIFQALLGMWTVTMKLLPIVVMGHLLGGFTLLALLWWLNLKVRDPLGVQNSSGAGSGFEKFKPWAVVGLVVVAIQIALGGWTSANYAALVCPNFPYCSAHQFFPQIDFSHAFNIFNFSNNHLSTGALMTIQMVHRLGALVTAAYVGLLSICLISLKQRGLRTIGIAMLAVLVAQITLGILNVELMLPLAVAVLHNIMAAFLLLTMVSFIFKTFSQTQPL